MKITLKELREITALSQREVAKRLSRKQAHISRFERKENHTVSHLRKYCEALGGTLEIMVRIGNEKFILNLGEGNERTNL